MKYNLEKILNLIQKTGDKCIYFDPRSEENFVIMSVEEYERMLGNTGEIKDLTQEQLLDKINRDIANWKAENENEMSDWIGKETIENIDFNQEESEENEEKFYLEPLE